MLKAESSHARQITGGYFKFPSHPHLHPVWAQVPVPVELEHLLSAQDWPVASNPGLLLDPPTVSPQMVLFLESAQFLQLFPPRPEFPPLQ